MRLILLCVAVLSLGYVSARESVVDATEARSLYEQFKRKYNKISTNEAEEFAATYTNAQFGQKTEKETMPLTDDNIIPDTPASIDWRTKGAVGPVVDQGDCRSDWASSVIGNIEGQWFRKTGNLLALSTQQVLDCDERDHGCQGGNPPYAYTEITRLGGLMLEADYPYTTQHGSCRLNQSKVVAYTNSSIEMAGAEYVISDNLARRGPMSMGLNSTFLQLYVRGIMHPIHGQCGAAGMDHHVLTVGYDQEENIPYWIARNSWGTNWGEDGYFRIYRGDGSCGINMQVTSAIIK